MRFFVIASYQHTNRTLFCWLIRISAPLIQFDPIKFRRIFNLPRIPRHSISHRHVRRRKKSGQPAACKGIPSWSRKQTKHSTTLCRNATDVWRSPVNESIRHSVSATQPILKHSFAAAETNSTPQSSPDLGVAVSAVSSNSSTSQLFESHYGYGRQWLSNTFDWPRSST